MQTSDFSKGTAIKYNGETYLVTAYNFVNPGKGSAFTRTKLKNAKTGKVIEVSFRSGEDIEEANVEYRKSQYLYNDGSALTLMDNQNYEQFELPIDNVGDQMNFIIEGSDVVVVYIDGKPFALQLPPKLVFEVVDAPPGDKGDTATGGSKQVEIETGAKVNAPLFIKAGDKIRVNTDSGEYVERAN